MTSEPGLREALGDVLARACLLLGLRSDTTTSVVDVRIKGRLADAALRTLAKHLDAETGGGTS